MHKIAEENNILPKKNTGPKRIRRTDNMPECAIIAICAVCGALIGTLVSIVAALHNIADAIDREYEKLNNKHD